MRLQPGFESAITKRSSIVSLSNSAFNTEPPSPDRHNIEHYKQKREKEVRKNFQRYITEIVSKEGNTMHQKKDAEFYQRIESDVDKVSRKIASKQSAMEPKSPTKPQKQRLTLKASSNAAVATNAVRDAAAGAKPKRHTLR